MYVPAVSTIAGLLTSFIPTLAETPLEPSVPYSEQRVNIVTIRTAVNTSIAT